MVTTNLKLLVIVIVLLVVSFWSYQDSTQVAERFERGQSFLPSLNIDNVFEIEITKGESATKLQRQDKSFVVSNRANYPADTVAVNRFFKSMLEIKLNAELGDASEAKNKEFECVDGLATSTKVVLRDKAKKDFLTFYVGKSLEDGGYYLRRQGGDRDQLFVSQSYVSISSEAKSFIKRKLTDFADSRVQRIEGSDFKIERQDGELKLLSLPEQHKLNDANFGQIQRVLANLSAEEVFVANDESLAGLVFGNEIKILLDDQTGYTVQTVSKDEKSFLKIKAFHELDLEAATRILPDESEEKLKLKSKVLNLADEIETFNTFHGSWVYEVASWNAKKFGYKLTDLIEKVEEPTPAPEGADSEAAQEPVIEPAPGSEAAVGGQ